MIITTLYDLLQSGSPPVVLLNLTILLLVLISVATFLRRLPSSSSASSRFNNQRDSILPGIPELKGVPILGALPMYLRKGIPHVISRMIGIGGDRGIAYANVVSSVLVSVHDPALVKEVLGFSDEIASREGDTSSGMSWSPFWTLRRMIGSLSLFNYVGPETRHQRSVFIREFNSTKSNRDRFPTVARLAREHCASLLLRLPPDRTQDQTETSPGQGRRSRSSPVVVNDIRLAADNFAISLWGDILYANPNNHLDENGKVRTLSNKIIDLAGDPWPAIWYYLQQAVLGLLSPGQPTASERKLRDDIEGVIARNISRLTQWEESNSSRISVLQQKRDGDRTASSTSGMKTLRALSVQTGGPTTGPLSKFATEFANLNLFGGHHSIGLNVVWAIIELGRHPEKMRRLVEEIDSVAVGVGTANLKREQQKQQLDGHPRGEKAEGEEDGDDWELDWTKFTHEMPYLDAVLTEVNRLYPTVHATLRVINKDVVLKGTSTTSVINSSSKTGTTQTETVGSTPGKSKLSTRERRMPPTSRKNDAVPVLLRKGMIVYMSYWYLATAEKYWGSDSKQFIPERFLSQIHERSGDENGAAAGGMTSTMKKRPIGPLMRFGYGPRSCVGYKFAGIAAKVYLITLLKMYRLEVQGDEHGMKLGTLLEPGKPVAVRITRRR